MLAQRKSMKPDKSSSIMKTGLPAPIAICFLTFVLFLIAATIVLSLIPLFVESPSAQRSTASAKSSPVTMHMNTGITVNSRRKRDSNSSSSNLQDHIGDKFGPDGITQFNDQLGPLLAEISPNFGGLSDVSITIGVSYSTKRRRAIKKRAIGYIALIVECTVEFNRKCTGKCQTDTGNSIRALLPGKVTVNTVVLTNIILVDKSGQPVGAIVVIPVLEVLYISPITPVVTSKHKTTHAPPTVFTQISTTSTTATTTATTPTTTACVNAINYIEPITGHTCQTYIDYGFCNGTSIVSASHVNVSLAQDNCCACGKGRTQSAG
ncbi:unnamed protein product [Rotaria socialis]